MKVRVHELAKKYELKNKEFLEILKKDIGVSVTSHLSNLDEDQVKKIDDYKANYSKYLTLRAERREKLEQAKRNQDAEIKQMEDNINRFRASATKASFAQSLIKKLEKIERIELDNEDVSKFNIRFQQSIVPGKVIFEAENLGKKYGDKQIFDHVDFFVNRGQKIALLGQNGQGKTTLAKILAGEIISPNSYSIRTLEILSTMTMLDAKAFSRLACFAISDGGIYPFSYIYHKKHIDDINKNVLGLSYSDILSLLSCQHKDVKAGNHTFSSY